MKQAFLGSVAVVGLLTLVVGSPRPTLAQVLRQPTVDDRFRDGGVDKGTESELPVLNPPQSKLVPERHEMVRGSGPAYLGVTFDTDESDAVVKAVTPGSPAAQAGLQPTDVIESIQGRPVRTYQDVLGIVATMRPGDMLDLEFSRRMSVRTRAALTALPAAVQRTVGYQPDGETPGFGAATYQEHELLPVPAGTQRKTFAAAPPSTHSTKPQTRSSNPPDQRRYNNQNNKQNGSNGRSNDRGLLRRRD